jgi:hypothetical protein
MANEGKTGLLITAETRMELSQARVEELEAQLAESGEHLRDCQEALFSILLADPLEVSDIVYKSLVRTGYVK